MEPVSISVIVTTYNVVDFIEQCLESLMTQTLKNIEIIVVDDASTDGTSEKITELQKIDERIKLIQLPNNTPGGTGIPSNIGLEEATGEYIGFADGDDWCEPNMFELLYLRAEATSSDIAFCNYENCDSISNELFKPADAHRWEKLNTFPEVAGKGFEEKQQFLKMIAVPWRKLYKREFLESHKIRFPEGDYFFEDNPFHWFVVVLAERISIVDHVLCYHRVNRAGQTMSTVDDRLTKMFIHHVTIHTWLKEQGKLEAYKVPLCQWLISQMHWISKSMSPEFHSSLFTTLREEFSKYSFFDIKNALVANKENPLGSALVIAVTKNNLAQYTGLLGGENKANPYNLTMIAYRETPQSIYQFLKKSGHKKITSMSKNRRTERIEERLSVIEEKIDKILTKTTIVEPSVMWIMKDVEKILEEKNSK